MELAAEKKLIICFLYQRRTYLLEGNVFIKVYSDNPPDKEITDRITDYVDIYKGQPIDRNADYGSLQLAEVAIKALSPGINDPATAVLSINALTNILAKRMYCQLPEVCMDNERNTRIYCPSTGFKNIFEECIIPIWRYGKNDLYIQDAMRKLLAS